MPGFKRPVDCTIKAGKRTRTEKIRNPKQRVRSIPIVEIPLWPEKERLPVLIIVVSELKRIARAVLVFNMLPSGGGACL